jgi:hypothetical protein
VTALTPESPNQFRVRFDALGRAEGRASRESIVVDPYLIGRAIAEVMRHCNVRSALGRALAWNEYRVILSRVDAESLGPLRVALEGDLEAATALEAEERALELVGEVRVTVVVDESDELRPGVAVIRTAFVSPEPASASAGGLETVREDAPAPRRTPIARAVSYRLAWATGEATLVAGATVFVGRPHPGAPPGFVALEGASARINKQQIALTPGPGSVLVRRLASANPVEVSGEPLAAGAEVAAKLPATIVLSKGDLLLVVSRT